MRAPPDGGRCGLPAARFCAPALHRLRLPPPHLAAPPNPSSPHYALLPLPCRLYYRCPAAPRRAAAYSVKTVLQSIQSLLADPNVDSPLNVHAAKLWGVAEGEYRALVLKTYQAPRPAGGQ